MMISFTKPSFRGYSEGKMCEGAWSGVLKSVVSLFAAPIIISVLFLTDKPLAVKLIESVLQRVEVILPVFFAVLCLSFFVRLVSKKKMMFDIGRSASVSSNEIARRLEVDAPIDMLEVAEYCARCSASLFSSIGLEKNSIGAAVRLIDKDGNYATVAREGNLNANRSYSSEALRPDGKLLVTLGNDELKGYPLFICKDVPLAQERKDIEQDTNSRLFSGEINSMIVCRLYVWDVESQCRSQVGLLYITSSRKNRFDASHVDAVLTIANMFESLAMFAIMEEGAYEE